MMNSYQNQNPFFCIIRSYRSNVNCKYLDVPALCSRHNLMGFLTRISLLYCLTVCISLCEFVYFVLYCIWQAIARLSFVRSFVFFLRHTTRNSVYLFRSFAYCHSPLFSFHLPSSKCHKADHRKWKNRNRINREIRSGKPYVRVHVHVQYQYTGWVCYILKSCVFALVCLLIGTSDRHVPTKNTNQRTNRQHTHHQTYEGWKWKKNIIEEIKSLLC